MTIELKVVNWLEEIRKENEEEQANGTFVRDDSYLEKMNKTWKEIRRFISDDSELVQKYTATHASFFPIKAEIKAVFVHNNAYDTILVSNGYAVTVDNELFKDFLENGLNEEDFDNWASSEYWDDDKEIMQAADDFGEVVAYISDKLIIVDEKRFANRKEFYEAEEGE